MDRADNSRSLLEHPSVVIGYFEMPESLQAALAELRDLGLQAGDLHVIKGAPTAAAVEPTPAPSLFQRLRSLLGQPSPPVAPASVSAPIPGQTIVVVQASRLPGVPIVEILERHGASKVETRDTVHTATQQAYEK